MIASLAVGLAALVAGVVIGNNRFAKGKRYEAIWSISFILIGAALSIAMIRHIPLPNPLDWITILSEPIFKPIMSWIGVKED